MATSKPAPTVGLRLEDLPEVLTLDELAGFLRVHRRTLSRMCEQGQIPYRKIGDTYRFSKRAIQRWLEEAASE